MATISLTVPNEKANAVYDAFRAAYGHDVEDPTTQQKLDFVKAKLISYVREIVHANAINEYQKNKPAVDDTVVA